MASVTTYVPAPLLALLLTSCAIERSQPRPATAPVTNLAQVLSDPAVKHVTQGLETQGFELRGAKVSQMALLADAPGVAFTLVEGTLHIHAYIDAPSAASAANRIVTQRLGQRKWAAPPMLYQCGSAIAMYVGPTPSVASALTHLCASPFYVHPSLRAHSAELISEGPGKLQSQVSRLNVHRRQITSQVRRKSRRMAGGRNCASIALPDSAFLPVEITGDANPELAVSLNQVSCPLGVFIGSPGGVVQFWGIAGRQPRLILEQQIEGFTPSERRLVTLQHGGSCGAAGAARCLVTYVWNPKSRTMQVANRAPISADDGLSTITFDYDLRRRTLGGTTP